MSSTLDRSSHDRSSDLWEELDQRVSAGFEISLLWIRRENSLIVCVEDSRTGECVELPVTSGEALEVFNHPFAYVAARGSRQLRDRSGWTVWTAGNGR
jgi:hypothetical protein